MKCPECGSLDLQKEVANGGTLYVSETFDGGLNSECYDQEVHGFKCSECGCSFYISS